MARQQKDYELAWTLLALRTGTAVEDVIEEHRAASVNSKKTRKPTTKNASTQTEDDQMNAKMEFMQNTIRALYLKIHWFKAQHKKNQSSDDTLNKKKSSPSSSFNLKNITKRKIEIPKTNKNKKYDRENENSTDDEKILTQYDNISSNDLVPIGEGNAKVPGRILKNMSRCSFKFATRKLLLAVFSRRVLATHSLTGKCSPAFPNKPAKARLDPALVNDIVQTVTDFYPVTESLVRTCITLKCADESKMYKNKQKNMENIIPVSDED